MAEILTVLTFKSAAHIVGDGGTQSWAISPSRARRCSHVVCVRHQQGPYKAEGNELHKTAFLVGVVSGVVQASDNKDRWRVEVSEYAIINGPRIPLNSASPTQYFPSLSSIGIDEAALAWKPVTETPVTDAPFQAEDGRDDIAHDGEDVSPMSVFMQAKKLVADGLHVPMNLVKIVVEA